MPKKVIAPKLFEKTHAWYGDTWDNPNQGVQYVLEAFPELYRHALARMCGIFSAGELSLIIDALNGTFLMPQHIGQHLLADCEDGIALEGYDKKWKIDDTEFIKKLRVRNIFELAFLEIWAQAFWRQSDGGKNLNAWVESLAKNKNTI